MSPNLLAERRRRVVSVLDIFEAFVARLNSGEIVPNRLLAAALTSFREFEEFGCREGEARQPSRPVEAESHDAAQRHLMRLDQALESLERGEAGAAGEFVIDAREYIRYLREYMQRTSADGQNDSKQGHHGTLYEDARKA